VADLNYSRAGFGICDHKGAVYVFSGWDNGPVGTCEKFEDEKWEVFGSLAEGKEKLGCTKINDVAYIAGYGSKIVETFTFDT